MDSASIDFETASDADLKSVGVHRYIEDPSTRILCMSYGLPGQPIRTWVPGTRFPVELKQHLDAGGTLSAWNAAFERTIWREIAVHQHWFPAVADDRWINPQAVAMGRNLPASLDGTAAALGVDQRKDKEGVRLMREMAAGKPGDIKRLAVYCEQDVRVEQAISARLGGGLSVMEQHVYAVSEEVNQRGVMIDRKFVEAAAIAVAAYQKHVSARMQAAYGIKPTEVAKIRAYCENARVPLPDLRADTTDLITGEPSFYPDDVVEILRMRQLAASMAPTKFAAMSRAACIDDRLRGMFSYCGATQTGRWSGRIVQLQNLARPTMPYEDTLAAMDAFMAAGGDWRALGDDPLGVLLNCVRPSLIPGRGGVFTVGDESSIEARVLPWLAGCQGPLDVFRAGGDIYLHAASSIYHRPVTKDDKPERQIGKVATLALGYQGGKHAFVTMGRGYGVHVPEAEAEEIKVNWRAAHPEIVDFWWALQNAAFACIERPGVEFDVGPVTFRHTGSAMWIRLPSGRSLCYPRAHVRLAAPSWELDKPEEKQEKRPTLAFYSPAGSNMTLDFSYGGRLAENITQAVARDVLAVAMVRARRLPIVLHAHDEIVAEGDHVAALNEALTKPIKWAPGLPLAAEVTLRERYWK